MWLTEKEWDLMVVRLAGTLNLVQQVFQIAQRHVFQASYYSLRAQFNI